MTKVITLVLLVFLLVQCAECQKKKVWRIAHGSDWSAHEYINQLGYIEGFSMDLVNAVCAEAGIDCRLVWDRYTNCIEGDIGKRHSGGQGLMDGWYDACTGWMASVNRMSFLDYSAAFLKQVPARFYVKKNNPDEFNHMLINPDTMLGFLDGWIYDETCLNRNSPSLNNRKVVTSQVIHYTNPLDMERALQKGEIMAGFSGIDAMEPFALNSTIEAYTKLDPIHCSIQGNSMITRKGSAFPSLWNEGFAKIRSNGKFKKICKEANDVAKHGHRGKIECVEY